MGISRREREEAQAAGYVECSECGHPVEEHDNDGCSHVDDDYDCPCDERLTISDIDRIRADYGLEPTGNAAP
jgi:hypothetical protein